MTLMAVTAIRLIHVPAFIVSPTENPIAANKTITTVQTPRLLFSLFSNSKWSIQLCMCITQSQNCDPHDDIDDTVDNSS